MAKSLLKMFDIGEKTFLHFIDTFTDAALITDQDEEILYTIDSDANLFNAKSERLGAFRMDGKCEWYYQSINGHKTTLACGSDLLRGERQLIKFSHHLFQSI